MDFLTPEILQLGGLAVISLALVWAVVEISKIKKMPFNGSSKDILKELQLMNQNHLNTICEKIDKGNDRLVDAINQNNGILNEIKGLLGRR